VRATRSRIAGELATDDIVQLLVQTGAFDADGARSIVAATLGTRSPRCRRESHSASRRPGASAERRLAARDGRALQGRPHPSAVTLRDGFAGARTRLEAHAGRS
jgi:hypothetical protein